MDFYTSVEKLGDNILYVGYEDNVRIKKQIKYQPTVFVPTRKKTEYRTLLGIPVASVKPGGMRETKDFVDNNTVSNQKIHGNTDFVAQFISDKFPDGCEFDRNKINSTYIDIEVQSDKGFPQPDEARHPVTAITIKNNLNNTFIVWGLGDYDVSKSIIKGNRIEYNKCSNEKELLTKFLTHWSANVPDVISGWNVKYFDIPYLVNRVRILFNDDTTKKFSIHRIKPKRSQSKYEDNYYQIYGTSVLDYLQLFKKFALYGMQDSYRLDNIAHVVLGDKKLDYSEYSSLNELYINNHQKFIDYNIKDTELVERLDDKLGLISLTLTLSYKANVPYECAFGSTRIWDTYIYNMLRRHKLVISPQKPVLNDRQIEGAYVKEPITGMHDWVASFDLNSLYPHLIMQYNISPETIVEEVIPNVTVDKLLNREKYNIPKNRVMSATGQLFNNNQRGIFPQIVDHMYSERKAIKNKALEQKQKLEDLDTDDVRVKYEIEKKISHYDNEQMALKILMNSLYGAMSNEYFRYYDVRMAESISISRQFVIRWAEKTINEFLNKMLKTNTDYVLAIDTDSLYVRFKELIDKVIENGTNKKICKFIDNMSEQSIMPVFKDTFDELKTYMNAYEQKMFMEREIIANKVIFTGKKRYVANVLNNEGVQYLNPKMKITGIESVRSSTPQACRNLIEDTLRIMVKDNEPTIQKHIAEVREKFNSLPAEEVAFPRSMNNINKYKTRTSYGKGTPIHIRASILYNNAVKEKRLDKKYTMIENGDKAKFTYLKMPNPTGENVIAFNTILPREFDLHRYVDYEMQFNKAYLDPIRLILDVSGWSVEKKQTLEEFFT